MIKDLVQAVVGPVIAGFWSHLNLARYGALQYLATNRGVREYGSTPTFDEHQRRLDARPFLEDIMEHTSVASKDFDELSRWVNVVDRFY